VKILGEGEERNFPLGKILPNAKFLCSPLTFISKLTLRTLTFNGWSPMLKLREGNGDKRLPPSEKSFSWGLNKALLPMKEASVTDEST
jgi:hypothetical protein